MTLSILVCEKQTERVSFISSGWGSENDVFSELETSHWISPFSKVTLSKMTLSFLAQVNSF